MHTNKSTQNGITLVALVISIIVMLMLAGVSLNATVGENGIITQASQAKLAQEEATRRENLEFLFFDFNTSEFVGQTNGFSNYLGSLLNNGTFEELLYTNNVIVKYQGYYYEVAKQGKDYVVKNRLEDNLSGSTGGGGSGDSGSSSTGSNKNYIVTPDNLTTGNVEIASGSSYIVLDKISGENFNFEIPAGDPVTIQLMGDMLIDNKGYKRSAIDLAPGATLNLYVYGTVEVNSGYGEDASGKTPGKGGYAGIHVPANATLNLYGTGTITAIGGDAGSGEVANSSELHAGGGGAGAGIGGSGGNGGAPLNGNTNKTTKICPSGEAGESCGTVNIYNSLTVYAYGGAGGSGGTNSTGIGAGAGGYPAAGIGGGGAGGAGATCCAGAGGYSAGSGEGNLNRAFNGLAGYPAIAEFPTNPMHWEGGGYYVGQGGLSGNNNYLNMQEELLGGMGGCSYYPGHSGGDGGTAGKGGIIKVSQNAKIFAYNGNRYTDGTDYENGLNQATIYLQNGISIPRYAHTGNEDYTWPIASGSNGFLFTQKQTLIDNVDKSTYQNTAYSNVPSTKRYITLNKYLQNVDMSYQGIGSGAGFIEISNGTYTVDATLN